MSATLGITEYECAYVGRRPLAKKYGDQPLYHVSQRRMKRVLTAGTAPDASPSSNDVTSSACAAPSPALASSTAGAVVTTMTNMAATVFTGTRKSFGSGARRQSTQAGPDPLSSGDVKDHPWSKHQSRQQSFPEVLLSPISRARRSLSSDGLENAAVSEPSAADLDPYPSSSSKE